MLFTCDIQAEEYSLLTEAWPPMFAHPFINVSSVFSYPSRPVLDASAAVTLATNRDRIPTLSGKIRARFYYRKTTRKRPKVPRGLVYRFRQLQM